jgi:hypothetical protein
MPSIPHETLVALEAGLDVARPEATPGAALVGFGEISLVFRPEAHPQVVVKRMAGFRSGAAAAAYGALVAAYVERLVASGLRVAATRVETVAGRGGPVAYLVQEAVPPASLGHARLRAATPDGLGALLAPILTHVAAALRPGPDGARLGLDAQLSNWAFIDDGPPRYLDLTTPLLRAGGVEQLDLGLLLGALPAPLGWALARSGQARRMLDRYYDPRSVALDLVANFVKEGRPDLVSPGLAHVNAWLGERPLSLDEVRRDYRGDARAWAFIQGARRVDRALARLTGRRYAWPLQPPVPRYPAGDAR